MNGDLRRFEDAITILALLGFVFLIALAVCFYCSTPERIYPIDDRPPAAGGQP